MAFYFSISRTVLFIGSISIHICFYECNSHHLVCCALRFLLVCSLEQKVNKGRVYWTLCPALCLDVAHLASSRASWECSCTQRTGQDKELQHPPNSLQPHGHSASAEASWRQRPQSWPLVQQLICPLTRPHNITRLQPYYLLPEERRGGG